MQKPKSYNMDAKTECGGDVKQVLGKLPAGWERGVAWLSDMPGAKSAPKEATGWHGGVGLCCHGCPVHLCVWVSTSNTFWAHMMLW